MDAEFPLIAGVRLLDAKPHWDYAIVEQDSVGNCIVISYTSLTECRDEDVSHDSLSAVIASLGEDGWELIATTDAFSPTERRVRTFAFKRLHDEAPDILD